MKQKQHHVIKPPHVDSTKEEWTTAAKRAGFIGSWKTFRDLVLLADRLIEEIIAEEKLEEAQQRLEPTNWI